MLPLLAYLVDSAIDVLDLLDDGDEIDEVDDIVMLGALEEGEEEEEEEDDLEEEEDEDEEGGVIVYDEDEISQDELSQDTQDTDDSDEDENSPPVPKLRRTQNLGNPRDAETSSSGHADENRPSTSRQPPVDFRHSVQLQLAPQPTLYQQDERLEPQLITIQARSTLESTSSQSTQTNGMNVQRGIVVVPQVQQFHRSDFLQSFSHNSIIQGREGSYSVSHRIHYLHLYPREE